MFKVLQACRDKERKHIEQYKKEKAQNKKSNSESAAATKKSSVSPLVQPTKRARIQVPQNSEEEGSSAQGSSSTRPTKRGLFVPKTEPGDNEDVIILDKDDSKEAHEDQLQRDILLAKKDSLKQALKTDKTSRQEQEEIERALRMSMQDARKVGQDSDEDEKPDSDYGNTCDVDIKVDDSSPHTSKGKSGGKRAQPKNRDTSQQVLDALSKMHTESMERHTESMERIGKLEEKLYSGYREYVKSQSQRIENMESKLYEGYTGMVNAQMQRMDDIDTKLSDVAVSMEYSLTKIDKRVNKLENTLACFQQKVARTTVQINLNNAPADTSMTKEKEVIKPDLEEERGHFSGIGNEDLEVEEEDEERAVEKVADPVSIGPVGEMQIAGGFLHYAEDSEPSNSRKSTRERRNKAIVDM